MEPGERSVASGQATDEVGESGRVKQPLELISTDQPWGGVAASSYQEWIESLQQQYQAMGKAVPNWTQQVSKSGSMRHRRKLYSPYQTDRREAITEVKLGLKNIINRYAAKTQAKETQIYRETTAPNRKRLFYTQEQVNQLETAFTVAKYPSTQHKLQLAEALNMSSKQVSIWFQNRRCKDKRKVENGDSNPSQPSPSPEITNWEEHYSVVTTDTPTSAPLPPPPDLTPPPAPHAAEENIQPPTQIQQTVGMMEKMEL